MIEEGFYYPNKIYGGKKMIPFEHVPARQIADIIKRSIIGQDGPVETVATALSAHIDRSRYNMRLSNKENPIQTDNLLILGPTGTGKTESIRTAIRELNLPVPVIVVSVTSLSNTGYHGKNIPKILEDLAEEAHRLINKHPNYYSYYLDENDCTIEEKEDGHKIKRINRDAVSKMVIDMCSHGIIILDEIDKIRHNKNNPYEAVYAKKIQYELLKIIEGGSGFGEDALASQIDTSNILFICMGAFSDLLNPPPERPAIGFSGNNDTANNNHDTNWVPTTTELVDFGLVEELLGRLPIRCRYNALSANNLYKILTESAISPVYDFERLFWQTHNELIIENSALREIAKRAYEVQTGARALRTVMGDILYSILYDLDGVYSNHQIRITKATINGEKPVIKPIPTPLERLQEQNPEIWEKIMKRRREREKWRKK